MPRYQYNAINQNQQPVSGELEADSLQSAEEQLSQEGLVEVTLQMVTAANQSPGGKSDREAADVVFSDDNVEELGEAFAAMTRAGLPLEAGLRMMAEEHPSPRISRALLSLSEQLEAGKSWDEISAASSQQFPSCVERVVSVETLSRGILVSTESLLFDHTSRVTDIPKNLERIALFANHSLLDCDFAELYHARHHSQV